MRWRQLAQSVQPLLVVVYVRVETCTDPLRLPGATRIDEAIALLERLTHAEELADFLTLPAYELID